MKKSWIGILATGLLSTATAMAADQPAPGGGPPGAGREGGNRPAMRGDFQGRGGFGMPGLNEEQRQLFQEASQKNAEKLRALEEKFQAAQKELVEATLAASYDEGVVKTKAEAVASIQVEMTMLRAKALATVAPTLTADQKKQLMESRFAIMMLSGGGGGGAMIGRPGAPGGFRGGGPGERPNRGERPARDR